MSLRGIQAPRGSEDAPPEVTQFADCEALTSWKGFPSVLETQSFPDVQKMSNGGKSKIKENHLCKRCDKVLSAEAALVLHMRYIVPAC